MFQITLNIILDSEVRLSELELLKLQRSAEVALFSVNKQLDINDSNIAQEEL